MKGIKKKFVRERKTIHFSKNFGEKEIATRKKIAEEEIVIVEEVDQRREKEIMKDRGQDEITKGIEEAMKEIIDPMIAGGMIAKIVVMIVDGTIGKIVEIFVDDEVDRGHLQDQAEQIIRMITLEFVWKEHMTMIQVTVLVPPVVDQI